MNSTITTTDDSYYADVYASLPATVTWSYLGILIVVFVIVSIYAAYKLSKDDDAVECSPANWFGLIFDLRKIYLQAVIHTADQVSDVAVLAQFFRLAIRERDNPETFNVPGLDMMALFIGSLSCLFVYRLFSSWNFFYIAGGSLLLGLIQFFDFGVYLTIYLAWKLNRTEPIFWQDYLTHVEALFESIPQILIQSQFVLRSGNDNADPIILLSIIISFVSVIGRFVKTDYPLIKKHCHQFLMVDDNDKLVYPFISFGYCGLFLFRACEIITRLTCGIFLWAVLGFFPMFLVFSITFLVATRFLWKHKSRRFIWWFIAVPIECIAPGKRKHIIFRCCSNWIFLTLITVYSYERIWCLTCSAWDTRQAQIDKDAIIWSVGYMYFFAGWICSFLTPICWFLIVPYIYRGRVDYPESRREEIMILPRMFYRKGGCWTPTLTPLHFAVHRKFLSQMEEMLHNNEVDINAIRISGATALHSAVGRSHRDIVDLLLHHGADPSIVKTERWYFRCCMPWKWCGRNFYEGKTALEIAQMKVDREKQAKNVNELDQDHNYMQILTLLQNPPDPADFHKLDDHDHDNKDDKQIELNTKPDNVDDNDKTDNVDDNNKDTNDKASTKQELLSTHIDIAVGFDDQDAEQHEVDAARKQNPITNLIDELK